MLSEVVAVQNSFRSCLCIPGVCTESRCQLTCRLNISPCIEGQCVADCGVCVNRHKLQIKYISLLERMARSLASIDWVVIINQQCFIVKSVVSGVATLLDKVICRLLAKLDREWSVTCLLAELELSLFGMELRSRVSLWLTCQTMYLYASPFQLRILDDGHIPQSVCILNVV